jgi:nucleotide-binding universal stress UspA family protein
MLRKILVTITSSESDQYVFDHALMLAKATGAHLGLLHVTDPDETTEAPPSYIDNLEPYLSGDESDTSCYVGHFEAIEPDLFGKLVAKATSEGVSTDCFHCFGDPERAISDFVSAWNADLVVLGRRNRSGLAEFFLGSVSNYVLHHAPCSVYVVHDLPAVKPENSSGHKMEVST